MCDFSTAEILASNAQRMLDFKFHYQLGANALLVLSKTSYHKYREKFHDSNQKLDLHWLQFNHSPCYLVSFFMVYELF